MEVTPTGLAVDLGTQLDGKMRGPLTTYQAAPGDTVSLEVTVLNGDATYAVQLKRLETPGQFNSASNFLDWAEANAGDNPWTLQEVTNPPYFTKDDGSNGGIPWGGSLISYMFDLFIDPSTPADFYDLEFAVAGKFDTNVRWYQDEHFYLQVVPEPGTVLMMGMGLALMAAGSRKLKRSH
jgi:hypothetical protein